MVEFQLNGQNVRDVYNWKGARVNAIFQEFAQPDISIDTVTLGADACTILQTWIDENGYFAKCPFVIIKDTVTVFDGYIDLSEESSVKVHTGKYVVAIKKREGINDLKAKIDGYTFGLLQEKRQLQTVEIPYIVEKIDTTTEQALMAVTTYLLLKEIQESIKRTSESIKNLSIAFSNPLTTTKDLLNASLQAIIDLAYTGAMILILKDLVGDIINLLVPIVRKWKGFKIKDHLEAFVDEVGFNGIEFGVDMDDVYYFPSKQEEQTRRGIPNLNDYGYSLKEMFELVGNLFNAEVSVDANGVVQVRTEGDPYFIKNSTYRMQDILVEDVKYNTDELVGTRLISFATDTTDEWTIENYQGTAYEIHTRSTINEEDSTIKGFDRVDLPVCLASRKTGYTAFEASLVFLFSITDTLLGIFGASSDFADAIDQKSGMIKVSQNSWSMPKVVKLNSNLKLSSSRDSWSAKYLYENFYQYKSFVLNSFGYQRRVFKDKNLTMCIDDYNSLVENSYFTTSNGAIGKFTSLEMELDSDKAKASYWVQEIYDTNLKEEYVEP